MQFTRTAIIYSAQNSLKPDTPCFYSKQDSRTAIRRIVITWRRSNIKRAIVVNYCLKSVNRD